MQSPLENSQPKAIGGLLSEWLEKSRNCNSLGSWTCSWFYDESTFEKSELCSSFLNEASKCVMKIIVGERQRHFLLRGALIWSCTNGCALLYWCHELDGQRPRHVAHEQNHSFSHGGNWRSRFSQLGGASPAFFKLYPTRGFNRPSLPFNLSETLMWNTNKTLHFRGTLHFFDTKALFDDFVAEKIMTINH